MVKYVDRGSWIDSFYLAKCDGASATTYLRQSGKSHIPRTTITIEADIDRLQKEKAEAEAKEKALSKLTPAERQALGIAQPE